MVAKMASENNDPQADLYISSEANNMFIAKYDDFFEPLLTAVIRENTVDNLRDIDNLWVGLTYWARVLVYAKSRVDPALLTDYPRLADPGWRGKVLTESVGVNDISFVASFIKFYGQTQTEGFIQGLTANMARAPLGDGWQQILDILAQKGDVAVVNSQVLALMISGADKIPDLAQKVGVIFPDQTGSGAHINLCAIALINNAKNRDMAIKLAEYLTSVPVQEKLAAGNFEYPANPKAPRAQVLRSWDFIAQDVDYSFLGAYQGDAAEMMLKGGWK
jgi:iron(III) transport system substrate-binding protein